MEIGFGNDPNIIPIDIEDENGTKYVLKYRLGTNIFEAADAFIKEHELPYHHLDAIANHINQCTQGMKEQTTILPCLTRRTFPIRNYEKLQELLREKCEKDEDVIQISIMAQFIQAGKGFYLTAEMKRTIDEIMRFIEKDYTILPPVLDLFGGLSLKCHDAVKYYETINSYSKIIGIVEELKKMEKLTRPIKIMFVKYITNCFVTCPPELFMTMVHSSYGILMPFIREEFEESVKTRNSNMENAIAGLILNLTIAAISSSLAQMLAEGLYEMSIEFFEKSEDETVKAIYLICIGNYLEHDVLVRNEFKNRKGTIEKIEAMTNETAKKVWKEIHELLYGTAN